MCPFTIQKATVVDAGTIASMVQQLLEEIMVTTGSVHFDADLPAIVARSEQFISEGIYTVFMAVERAENIPVGFVTLTQTHSLYAGGAFGIIH